MSAPRKYDEEFRERAVRMCRDRLEQEPGESKAAALRQVGAVLGLNPALLRKWVEDAERDAGSRAPRAAAEPEEVRALKRRLAEPDRVNDILRTRATALLAQAELGLQTASGSPSTR